MINTISEQPINDKQQSGLMVNIQDLLQVFQESGIGKMEDNLTSADPLSYSTNRSRER